MSSVCRWGIMGTAQIARKNWQGIRDAENATLTAVASRTADRARQFVHECQSEVPFPAMPDAVAGYEALLARADIDAVYIPLPTALRKEWVLKAAAAGKHVLCEKPCGVNAGEVRTMIEACRDNNVQFMDGVMFMHSRRLDQLRQLLDDQETIGDLKRIATHHCFRAPDEFLQSNIRMSSDLEPLGCLGDLGWYNIRFLLWAVNWKKPERVSAHLLAEVGRPDSAAPVPVEFSAELHFPDGVSASFYCSFLTENQQWVNVAGTKGYLHMADFVLPFVGDQLQCSSYNASYQLDGCSFTMHPRHRNHTVQEPSNNDPAAQESNMFRTFSKLVIEGTPDPHWPRIALQTQEVMDACLESLK